MSKTLQSTRVLLHTRATPAWKISPCAKVALDGGLSDRHPKEALLGLVRATIWVERGEGVSARTNSTATLTWIHKENPEWDTVALERASFNFRDGVEDYTNLTRAHRFMVNQERPSTQSFWALGLKTITL